MRPYGGPGYMRATYGDDWYKYANFSWGRVRIMNDDPPRRVPVSDAVVAAALHQAFPVTA